mmetsp:Transcript_57585/g.153362  ORF Transcript_57585/g.153362 Transcript_57585/m.153362 type:complete len:599 (-) Transcript_57585:4429-6225(-)
MSKMSNLRRRIQWLHEEVAGRDNVILAEISDVRKHSLPLRGLNTHPFRDGNGDTLPWVLGDEATTPKIPRTPRLHVFQVLVEDASSVQSATRDEMVRTPCVVAAITVRIQGARKLRRRDEENRIPHTLRFHFGHKTLQPSVDRAEQTVGTRLHPAVRVPSAEGYVEEVPLGAARLPHGDEGCNRLQLSLKSVPSHVIRHQSRSSARRRSSGCRSPLQPQAHVRLCRLHSIQEVHNISLRKHIAVHLRGDVVDDREKCHGLFQGIDLVRDQLRFHVKAVGPHGRTPHRKGVRQVRRRPTGERVGNASPEASRSCAAFLAPQCLRAGCLRAVRIESHAPLRTAVVSHGEWFHQPAHVDEKCSVTLVVQSLQHRQSSMNTEGGAISSLSSRIYHEHLLWGQGQIRSRLYVLVVNFTGHGNNQVVGVRASPHVEIHQRFVRPQIDCGWYPGLHGPDSVRTQRVPEGVELRGQYNRSLCSLQAAAFACRLVCAYHCLSCVRGHALTRQQQIKERHGFIQRCAFPPPQLSQSAHGRQCSTLSDVSDFIAHLVVAARIIGTNGNQIAHQSHVVDEELRSEDLELGSQQGTSIHQRVKLFRLHFCL